MDVSFDLPLIWAFVIAFVVTMYVLLDGFSLGVGILFPFSDPGSERDLMMNTVAPVWDGNQTWLVLGGTSLFAAFPAAFSLLLSALYLPLMVMLIALVFRGVAFEFRFKATRRWVWDLSFSGGSALAAFCQGLVLGAYVQGFDVVDGHYVGGAFGWLSAFSIMTGVAVVCAYALLAACWLVIKTEVKLQAWARRVAVRMLWVVVFFIVLVSVWTPLMSDAIATRWFTWPRFAYLSPVPLVTALLALGLGVAIRQRSDHAPFLLCVALYLLTLGGLAISLWPFIVPRSVTVWQAAAAPATQIFMLVGTLIIIPVILIYTGHAYYVFRGKVQEGEGYH